MGDGKGKPGHDKHQDGKGSGGKGHSDGHHLFHDLVGKSKGKGTGEPKHTEGKGHSQPSGHVEKGHTDSHAGKQKPASPEVHQSGGKHPVPKEVSHPAHIESHPKNKGIMAFWESIEKKTTARVKETVDHIEKSFAKPAGKQEPKIEQTKDHTGRSANLFAPYTFLEKKASEAVKSFKQTIAHDVDLVRKEYKAASHDVSSFMKNLESSLNQPKKETTDHKPTHKVDHPERLTPEQRAKAGVTDYEDPNSHKHYKYDNHGRLSEVENANGRHLKVNYKGDSLQPSSYSIEGKSHEQIARQDNNDKYHVHVDQKTGEVTTSHLETKKFTESGKEVERKVRVEDHQNTDGVQSVVTLDMKGNRLFKEMLTYGGREGPITLGKVDYKYYDEQGKETHNVTDKSRAVATQTDGQGRPVHQYEFKSSADVKLQKPSTREDIKYSEVDANGNKTTHYEKYDLTAAKPTLITSADKIVNQNTGDTQLTKRSYHNGQVDRAEELQFNKAGEPTGYKLVDVAQHLNLTYKFKDGKVSDVVDANNKAINEHDKKHLIELAQRNIDSDKTHFHVEKFDPQKVTDVDPKLRANQRVQDAHGVVTTYDNLGRVSRVQDHDRSTSVNYVGETNQVKDFKITAAGPPEKTLAALDTQDNKHQISLDQKTGAITITDTSGAHKNQTVYQTDGMIDHFVFDDKQRKQTATHQIFGPKGMEFQSKTTYVYSDDKYKGRDPDKVPFTAITTDKDNRVISTELYDLKSGGKDPNEKPTLSFSDLVTYKVDPKNKNLVTEQHTATDLRGSSPVHRVTTTTEDLQTHQKATTVDTTTAERTEHVKIVNGKATEMSIVQHGQPGQKDVKIDYVINPDGTVKAVRLDGKILDDNKAKGLKDYFTDVTKVLSQQRGLNGADFYFKESDCLPTGTRPGVTPKSGTFVWRDDNKVLHQGTVVDGKILDQNKNPVGTINDQGVATIGNKQISIADNPDAMFYGIGSDNQRLSVVSKRDAGGYNGFLTNPDQSDKIVVVGGNAFDKDGKFLGHFDKNGLIESADNNPPTQTLGSRFTDWRFEGTQDGHRRMFVSSNDLTGGTIFLQGKKHIVENGMVINPDTGEQVAFFKPPLNAAVPVKDDTSKAGQKNDEEKMKPALVGGSLTMLDSGEEISLHDPRLINSVFDVHVNGRPSAFQFATVPDRYNPGQVSVVDLQPLIQAQRDKLSSARRTEADLDAIDAQEGVLHYFNTARAMDYWSGSEQERQENAAAAGQDLQRLTNILQTGHVDQSVINEQQAGVDEAARKLEAQMKEQHDKEIRDRLDKGELVIQGKHGLEIPEVKIDTGPPKMDSDEKAKQLYGKARVGNDGYEFEGGKVFKAGHKEGDQPVGVMTKGYVIQMNDGRMISLADTPRVIMRVHFGKDSTETHDIIGLGPKEVVGGQVRGGGLVDKDQLMKQATQDLNEAQNSNLEYFKERGWCHGLTNMADGDLESVIKRQAEDIKHHLNGLNKEFDSMFKEDKAFDPKTFDNLRMDQCNNAVQNMLNSCHSSAADAKSLGATAAGLEKQADEALIMAAMMASGAAVGGMIAQLGEAGRLGALLQESRTALTVTRFLASTATAGSIGAGMRYREGQTYSQIAGSYLEAATMNLPIGEAFQGMRGLLKGAGEARALTAAANEMRTLSAATNEMRTLAGTANEARAASGFFSRTANAEVLWKQSELAITSIKDAVGFYTAGNLKEGHSLLYTDGRTAMQQINQLAWNAGAMYIGHYVSGGLTAENLRGLPPGVPYRAQPGLMGWLDHAILTAPQAVLDAGMFSALDAVRQADAQHLEGAARVQFLFQSFAEGAAPMILGHFAGKGVEHWQHARLEHAQWRGGGFSPDSVAPHIYREEFTRTQEQLKASTEMMNHIQEQLSLGNKQLTAEDFHAAQAITAKAQAEHHVADLRIKVSEGKATIEQLRAAERESAQATYKAAESNLERMIKSGHASESELANARTELGFARVHKDAADTVAHAEIAGQHNIEQAREHLAAMQKSGKGDPVELARAHADFELAIANKDASVARAQVAADLELAKAKVLLEPDNVAAQRELVQAKTELDLVTARTQGELRQIEARNNLEIAQAENNKTLRQIESEGRQSIASAERQLEQAREKAQDGSPESLRNLSRAEAAVERARAKLENEMAVAHSQADLRLVEAENKFVREQANSQSELTLARAQAAVEIARETVEHNPRNLEGQKALIEAQCDLQVARVEAENTRKLARQETECRLSSERARANAELEISRHENTLQESRYKLAQDPTNAQARDAVTRAEHELELAKVKAQGESARETADANMKLMVSHAEANERLAQIVTLRNEEVARKFDELRQSPQTMLTAPERIDIPSTTERAQTSVPFGRIDLTTQTLQAHLLQLQATAEVTISRAEAAAVHNVLSAKLNVDLAETRARLEPNNPEAKEAVLKARHQFELARQEAADQVNIAKHKAEIELKLARSEGEMKLTLLKEENTLHNLKAALEAEPHNKFLLAERSVAEAHLAMVKAELEGKLSIEKAEANLKLVVEQAKSDPKLQSLLRDAQQQIIEARAHAKAELLSAKLELERRELARHRLVGVPDASREKQEQPVIQPTRPIRSGSQLRDVSSTSEAKGTQNFQSLGGVTSTGHFSTARMGITRILEREGNIARLQHPDGRMMLSSPEGWRVKIAADGNITKIVDSTGRTHNVLRDEAGRIVPIDTGTGITLRADGTLALTSAKGEQWVRGADGRLVLARSPQEYFQRLMEAHTRAEEEIKTAHRARIQEEQKKALLNMLEDFRQNCARLNMNDPVQAGLMQSHLSEAMERFSGLLKEADLLRQVDLEKAQASLTDAVTKARNLQSQSGLRESIQKENKPASNATKASPDEQSSEKTEVARELEGKLSASTQEGMRQQREDGSRPSDEKTEEGSLKPKEPPAQERPQVKIPEVQKLKDTSEEEKARRAATDSAQNLAGLEDQLSTAYRKVETDIGEKNIADRVGSTNQPSPIGEELPLSGGPIGAERTIKVPNVQKLDSSRLKPRIAEAEDGLVTSVARFDGTNQREFEYSVIGKGTRFLSKVTHPDGSVWHSKDGLNWTRTGADGSTEQLKARCQVTADGALKVTDRHGMQLFHPDGSREYRAASGGHLIERDGRVESMVDAAGRPRQLQYNEKNELSSVTITREKGVETWVKVDENEWLATFPDSADPISLTGKFRLAPDGTTTFEYLGGATRTFSLDGSISSRTPGRKELLSETHLRGEFNQLLHDIGFSVESSRLRARIETNMDFLLERAKTGGVSETEVGKSLHFVRELLEHQDENVTTLFERQLLAEQLLYQAAFPTFTDQGHNPTCTVASGESCLYARQPSAVIGLVKEVALTGQFTTTEGVSIRYALPGEPVTLRPDKNAQENIDSAAGRVHGLRTYASQIYQKMAVNIRWAGERYHFDGIKTTDVGAGNIRYDGHCTVDMRTDPPTKLTEWRDPCLFTADIPAITRRITGETREFVIQHPSHLGCEKIPAGNRIQSAEQMVDMLLEMKQKQNIPLLITVHTFNEPFWTDSNFGGAGGSGGGHAVSIVDFEIRVRPGDPRSVAEIMSSPRPEDIFVKLDNQWGKDVDHVLKTITLRDLYQASIASQDPQVVRLIEQQLSEHPGDLGLRLDLLRSKRELGKNKESAEKLLLADATSPPWAVRDEATKARLDKARDVIALSASDVQTKHDFRLAVAEAREQWKKNPPRTSAERAERERIITKFNAVAKVLGECAPFDGLVYRIQRAWSERIQTWEVNKLFKPGTALNPVKAKEAFSAATGKDAELKPQITRNEPRLDRIEKSAKSGGSIAINQEMHRENSQNDLTLGGEKELKIPKRQILELTPEQQRKLDEFLNRRPEAASEVVHHSGNTEIPSIAVAPLIEPGVTVLLGEHEYEVVAFREDTGQPILKRHAADETHGFIDKPSQFELQNEYTAFDLGPTKFWIDSQGQIYLQVDRVNPETGDKELGLIHLPEYAVADRDQLTVSVRRTEFNPADQSSPPAFDSRVGIVYRNSQGRPLEIIEPSGERITINRDSSGTLTSIRSSTEKWEKNSKEQWVHTDLSSKKGISRFAGEVREDVQVLEDGTIWSKGKAGTEWFRHPDGSSEKVEPSGRKELLRVDAQKETEHFHELMENLSIDSVEKMRLNEYAESFEARSDLSDLEKGKAYRYLNEFLESSEGRNVNARARTQIAEQVLKNIANPLSITQGQHNTCNVATQEARLCMREPSQYVRFIKDVALTGRYTVKSGIEIAIPQGSSRPDIESLAHMNASALRFLPGAGPIGLASAHELYRQLPHLLTDPERNIASQIFQIGAVNVGVQQKASINQDGIIAANRSQGELFVYRQERPDQALLARGVGDTGERLVLRDAYGNERVVAGAPKLSTSDLDKVYSEISGLNEKVTLVSRDASSLDSPGRDFETKEELAQLLQERLLQSLRDGKPLCETIWVHTFHEPFYTDSGAGREGGSGGAHVVNIVGIRPDGRGGYLVEVDNSWRRAAEHLDTTSISLDDLYLATHWPDNAQVLQALQRKAAADPTNLNLQLDLLRHEFARSEALRSALERDPLLQNSTTQELLGTRLLSIEEIRQRVSELRESYAQQQSRQDIELADLQHFDLALAGLLSAAENAGRRHIAEQSAQPADLGTPGGATITAYNGERPAEEHEQASLTRNQAERTKHDADRESTATNAAPAPPVIERTPKGSRISYSDGHFELKDNSGGTRIYARESEPSHPSQAIDVQGRTYGYSYDENGYLSRIQFPDGTTATRSDVDTWQMVSSGESWTERLSYSMSPEGYLRITDENGVLREVRLDGTQIKTDGQQQVILGLDLNSQRNRLLTLAEYHLEPSDVTSLHRSIDNLEQRARVSGLKQQFLAESFEQICRSIEASQQRLARNEFIERVRENLSQVAARIPAPVIAQITVSRAENGERTVKTRHGAEFVFNEAGEPVRFIRNGKTWTKAEREWLSSDGQRFEGSVHIAAGTGNIVIARNDGILELHDNTGTRRVYESGRLTEMQSAVGTHFKYEYDTTRQPPSLKSIEANGSKLDAVTFRPDGTVEWTTAVLSDGSLLRTKLNTNGSPEYSIESRSTGCDLVRDSKGRIVEVRNLNHAAESAALKAMADWHISDPMKRARFLTDMSIFEERAITEGLPAREITEAYAHMNRMLASIDDRAMPVEYRIQLAREFLWQGANPNFVDQGNNSTCQVAAIESRMNSLYPSSTMKAIAELSTTGKYVTAHGTEIDYLADRRLSARLEPDAEALLAAHKMDIDHNTPAEVMSALLRSRTFASQLMQELGINVLLREGDRQAGRTELSLYDGHSLHLADGTSRPFSGMDPDIVVSVSNAITGINESNFVFLSSRYLDPELESRNNAHQRLAQLTQEREQLLHAGTASPRELALKQQKIDEQARALQHYEKRINYLKSRVVFFEDATDLHNKIEQYKPANGKYSQIFGCHTADAMFREDSNYGQAGGSGGVSGGKHFIRIADYHPDQRTASLDNQWGKTKDRLGFKAISIDRVAEAAMDPADALWRQQLASAASTTHSFGSQEPGAHEGKENSTPANPSKAPLDINAWIRMQQATGQGMANIMRPASSAPPPVVKPIEPAQSEEGRIESRVELPQQHETRREEKSSDQDATALATQETTAQSAGQEQESKEAPTTRKEQSAANIGPKLNESEIFEAFSQKLQAITQANLEALERRINFIDSTPPSEVIRTGDAASGQQQQRALQEAVSRYLKHVNPEMLDRATEKLTPENADRIRRIMELVDERLPGEVLKALSEASASKNVPKPSEEGAQYFHSFLQSLRLSLDKGRIESIRSQETLAQAQDYARLRDEVGKVINELNGRRQGPGWGPPGLGGDNLWGSARPQEIRPGTIGDNRFEKTLETTTNISVGHRIVERIKEWFAPVTSVTDALAGRIRRWLTKDSHTSLSAKTTDVIKSNLIKAFEQMYSSPSEESQKLNDGKVFIEASLDSGASKIVMYRARLQGSGGEQEIIARRLSRAEDLDRPRREIAAYEISKALGLDNGRTPATVVRKLSATDFAEHIPPEIDPGATGQTLLYLQENVGRHTLEEFMQSERFHELDLKNDEAVAKLLSQNTELTTQLENAFIERIILGDWDVHSLNFVVSEHDGKLLVRNIDLEGTFRTLGTPSWQADESMGINEAFIRFFSERQVSAAVQERLKAFLANFANGQGKAKLSELGLNSDQIANLLERVHWFKENGRFPHADGATPKVQAVEVSHRQEISHELSRLRQALADQVIDRTEQQHFQRTLDGFLLRNDLTDTQKTSTLNELDRLVNGLSDTRNARDRYLLALDVLHNIYDPTRMRQGKHNTCGIAVNEVALAMHQPDAYAKFISDLFLTGQFVTKDGTTIVVPAEHLVADFEAKAERHSAPAFHSAVPLAGLPGVIAHEQFRTDIQFIKGPHRNLASEIFQIGAANVSCQRRSKAIDIFDREVEAQNGLFIYKQLPREDANDTGERLIYRFTDEQGRTVEQEITRDPSINPERSMDILHQIGNDERAPVGLFNSTSFEVGDARAFETFEELEQALIMLKSQQKQRQTEGSKDIWPFPVTTSVLTFHEPFFTDSNLGSAAGAGPHAINILDVVTVNGETYAEVLSTWNLATEHVGESRRVHLKDLYHATCSPDDPEVIDELRRKAEKNPDDRLAKLDLWRHQYQRNLAMQDVRLADPERVGRILSNLPNHEKYVLDAGSFRQLMHEQLEQYRQQCKAEHGENLPQEFIDFKRRVDVLLSASAEAEKLLSRKASSLRQISDLFKECSQYGDESKWPAQLKLKLLHALFTSPEPGLKGKAGGYPHEYAQNCARVLDELCSRWEGMRELDAHKDLKRLSLVIATNLKDLSPELRAQVLTVFDEHGLDNLKEQFCQANSFELNKEPLRSAEIPAEAAACQEDPRLRNMFDRELRKMAGSLLASEAMLDNTCTALAGVLNSWTALPENGGKKVALSQRALDELESRLSESIDAIAPELLLEPGFLVDRQFTREALKNHPSILKEYEGYVLAEIKHGELLASEVNAPRRARAEELNRVLSTIAKDLKIPEVSVNTGNLPEGTKGVYKSGTGRILLTADALRGALPPADLIRTVIHEFVHNEQDALVIRKLASDLAVSKNPSEQELKKLSEIYKEQFGANLERQYLLAALDGPRRLTKTQRERVEALQVSLQDKNWSDRDQVKNDINLLERNIKTLDDTGMISLVLNHIVNSEAFRQRLFGSKEKPQLNELMAEYRDTNTVANQTEAKQLLRDALVDRWRELRQKSAKSYTDYRDLAHEKEAFAAGELAYRKISEGESRERNSTRFLLRAIFSDEAILSGKVGKRVSQNPQDPESRSLSQEAEPKDSSKALSQLLRRAPSDTSQQGTEGASSSNVVKAQRELAKVLSLSLEKSDGFIKGFETHVDTEESMQLLIQVETLSKLAKRKPTYENVDALYLKLKQFQKEILGGDQTINAELNSIRDDMRQAMKQLNPQFGKSSFMDQMTRDNVAMKTPFDTWQRMMKAADWSSFDSLKTTLGSLDRIPGWDEWYCFDLGGNNYRLITTVDHKARTVTIYEAFSHEEYDRWWRDNKRVNSPLAPKQTVQF